MTVMTASDMELGLVIMRSLYVVEACQCVWGMTASDMELGLVIMRGLTL